MLSWHLEDSEKKDTLREEINDRIRAEKPKKVHLISPKSDFIPTDIFGEGFDIIGIDEDTEEIEEDETGDSTKCVCPPICNGAFCQPCDLLVHPEKQKIFDNQQQKRKADEILADISNKKASN